jgi:hypothetical protein
VGRRRKIHSDWYRERLQEVTKLLIEDPHDTKIQGALRAISSACLADKNLADLSKLEHQVDDLEKSLLAIEKERAVGADRKTLAPGSWIARDGGPSTEADRPSDPLGGNGEGCIGRPQTDGENE